MSPRNFYKISKLPKPILDQRVEDAPNLWYAFTIVTGIDKLFSYTADEISSKTNNDGKAILPPISYYEED